MYEIPIKPAWMVWCRTSKGNLETFHQFDSEEAAESAAMRFHNEDPELDIEVEPFDAIIPDRTLPTPNQIKEICWILHGALVMIRNLGHEDDKLDAMREIAEVLHETPVEMFNPRNWDWNLLLSRLRELEEKYPDARTYGLAHRFEEIYQKTVKCTESDGC